MKRFLATLLAAVLLAAAIPAQATSYGGYVRNWWVEPSGDITFYLYNVDNTVAVTGLCGSNVYRLKTTNANFDEVYSSMLLSAKNSYFVYMEVSTCSSTINYIDQTKICTYLAGC